MTSDNAGKASVDDLANNARSAAGHAADTAQDQASRAADGAQRAASSASEAAADLYSRAKDRAGDLSNQLPDRASDVLQAGREAYGKGSDRVIRQVTKQPIEALLLAGALGYLVGWATSRS